MSGAGAVEPAAGAAPAAGARRAVPLASVVVPAHDEGAVIDRCLRALGLPDDELEVVVVANGCSDDTAERARRYGARVVETDVASKSHALNLGDAACTAFPRAYVDADVELSGAALRAVVAELRAGRALAAAPAMHVDTAPASALVRAYYRVWTATPYVSHSMVGSGVYVLSEAGRARFGAFPDAIGDDTFVRGLFAPGERTSVPSASFTVHPPRSLRALLAIKTRAIQGHQQHRAGQGGPAPAGAAAEAGSVPSERSVLLRRRDLWPSLPVYLAVFAITRVRARLRSRRGDARWDRDTTSRPPAPTSR